MSILIGLLLASTDVVANQQPVLAQQTEASPAPKKVKEKKICKVDDADSGSHMTRRICLTAEQWNGDRVSTSRSGVSVSGEAMQGH